MHLLSQKKSPVEILLVEDSEGDVILFKKALSNLKTPYTINVAEDGEMALEALKNAKTERRLPDIIIMDFNLPKNNALDILRVLKQDSQLRAIPAIVFTGSKADNNIADAYDLYANAYVIKPTSFGEVVAFFTALEQFWFHHVAFSERST